MPSKTAEVTPSWRTEISVSPGAQVKAVCAPPISLKVTNPLTCEAQITSAALLDLVNLGNRVAAFRPLASATQPSGATSTTYTLQPLPKATDYIFPGGQTTPITLTASTPTAPVSIDTCQTSVAVALQKPVAKCMPAIALPATAGCAAHPIAADLKSAIDAGSTPGSGGPLTLTLNPAAPASGTYNLPVGTYPISLTVANCAGSDSCTTLVTVADQEDLQV